MYTARLIYSLRKHGWRGRIDVLTTDPNLHIASATMQVIEQTFNSRIFNDCRWLQMELDKVYSDGEKVMYIDCDCVIKKPIWKLFKYNFACVTGYDRYDQMGKYISKIASAPKDSPKYVVGPFVFKMNESVRMFFRMARVFCHFSDLLEVGTMVPFNIACYTVKKPKPLPMSTAFYWEDISEDEDERYDLAQFMERSKNASIIHYGGSRFKRLWQEEYDTETVHEERL